MMRYLYTCIIYLMTPFILLRLYWKGRRLPAYRLRIRERFALNAFASDPVDVWVHAVSLGEVVAVTPLIEAFLAKNWRVLVTTMTPTGSERVRTHFADRVIHQYMPYDLPWSLRRFFKRLKPRFGLIMETELWPNMIHYAGLAKIPLVLANARLSDRSIQQYKKLAFFFKPLLNQFNMILAQSTEDSHRFIALGATPQRVHALGNMKFDIKINAIDVDKFQALKKKWGEERVVFIAASTHDDEESQILSSLKVLQRAIPHIILLIAPRHPERFKAVYQLSIDAGFITGLRTREESITLENEVVVLDSLGELLGFYQVSDYAFVGGSLVPVGGHNVLEPIAAKIPVFCGLYMQNSKSICRDLENAGAIKIVSDAQALIEAVILVHQQADLKNNLVTSASLVLESNRGVIGYYLEILEVNL